MNKLKIVVSLLFCFFLSSCDFIYSLPPYLVQGNFIMDDSIYDDFSVFEYAFENNSEKTVTAFCLVFYLFDSDGNPAVNGNPCITRLVKKEIGPGEILKSFFSLDEYLAVVPEEELQVEYLYVSRIEYSDGSEWKDRFGVLSLQENK